MKSNRLYLIAALAVIVLLIASGCNSITGQTVLGTEKEREQSPDNSTGTKIACSSDLDCGKPMIGEPYCFQGNSLTPQNIPKCTYPGTINSKCTVEQKDKMVLCNKEKETCRSGACVLIALLPCSDTDGGKAYDRAGVVTDGLEKVYVDNCEDDRWLYERYCSHGTKGEGLTDEYQCEGKCSNGACVPKND